MARWRSLLLLHVLLPLLHVLLPASAADATSPSNSSSDLGAHCSRFSAFNPGIAEELLPWYDDEGISETLMDRTLRERTMSAAVPGLPLCIRGGKLYVIGGSQQDISRLFPWQADNIVVYAWALSRLVSRWGTALPDVEFVVETMDAPAIDFGPTIKSICRAGNTAGGEEGEEEGGGQVVPEPEDAEGGVWDEGPRHGRLPVMRHCKASSSVAIAVPIFHFYTMNIDDWFLGEIERFNRHHPWGEKEGKAFAAGVGYHRDQSVHSTVRQWDGARRGEVVERVREAFSTYLAQELQHTNISYSHDVVPLEQWARYKMVMHVDGITCSSRIFQLLALGSVVLREQSGYFAFYDKLMKKFHHYVPFWSNRPREVVWAYNWVTANDAAARAIAVRGQQFARQFLNREAIECYWVLLLQQYANLQRFTPGERRGNGDAGGGGVRQLELVPVVDWLKSQDDTTRHGAGR
ncbi:hypothetical protein VOLCADRAFT_106931 [Volvox carteri f. nagariensis]|uniref:Glycosyl transferase CAP10 domain-containing protein n=1 Tax=Volvox carteri f. nagariensis TaxID=3068 RepID=D8UAM7_VOLCA|nr:uncharacterized protein VOLCADRAFT_106931 [Volvox carteri f. nagariensis]EFJ43134.1 hypothetical protein VOLCADRAFT_106931 [Volvox carteri f. nagariensis]|eukprot:XP_002955709.1 hypothetical protein VOLCADRAFT_106931 [Volvox carteri f. nagariensis]